MIADQLAISYSVDPVDDYNRCGHNRGRGIIIRTRFQMIYLYIMLI